MDDLQTVEDLIGESQALIGADPLGSTFAAGEPESTLSEALLENCRIAVGKESGWVDLAGGNMVVDGATVAYSDTYDYWRKFKVYYMSSQASTLFTERPFIMTQVYYDTYLNSTLPGTNPVQTLYSDYCTTSYARFRPTGFQSGHQAYSFSWLAIQPYGELVAPTTSSI